MSQFAHRVLLTCLAGAVVGCHTSTENPAEHVARGYVLFSPLLSRTTYLANKQGEVVHTWQTEGPAAVSVYLLSNGHLLRSTKILEHPVFPGGYGGRLQEYDWDGELLWDWTVDSPNSLQHHDFEPLPNGNILLIAWEAKSRIEAIEAGRSPRRVGSGGLWPDCVLEIRPQGSRDAEVVWKWCFWDHLIQDLDSSRAHYGRPADHPELIDLNGDREPLRVTHELLRRLRVLGYVDSDTDAADFEADFMHTNSIDYNPVLDQIVLSVPRYHEIWIIDHSASSEEAAGQTGGRSGRGGDLLYRWGNPGAYGRGPGDQQLFAQHDAQWIPQGYPGAGNLTVFNNGSRRLRPYSSVIELEPPIDRDDCYRIEPGAPFGPHTPTWEYTAANKRSFFAAFISGAQRLRNGNTLVTSGPQGRLFEVTQRGETVWSFDNPYSGDDPNPEGDPPFSLFRATHLASDHPGLAGRDLSPLEPQPPRDKAAAGP